MRFLHLASNWFYRPADGSFTWPYSVDVSVGGPEVKVAFAEDVGHGAAAGVFDLADALSSSWTLHFERAEGDWLLPFLKRIARGETVEEEELVAAFTERHGRAPESYNWDLRRLGLASLPPASPLMAWVGRSMARREKATSDSEWSAGC